MIRATVNEWSPRDEPNRKIYSLKLKMVYMLSDVRDKLVKSVNISLDISKISQELIDEIESYTVNDKGKILKFQIHDPSSQMNLNLFSRKKQVELNDKFVDYLQNSSGFEFSLS